MGLLSDPNTRSIFVKTLKNHGSKLCVLSYLVGFGWFLLLAYRPLNAATYFSENALLPGLVEADYHHDHGASDYLREIRDEMQKLKDMDTRENQISHKIPSDWFATRFRNLGLDAYIQNFTFTYPASILKNQVFNGQNVYGILRAPRASSTESVVLSVPYRPPQAEGDRTTGGLALMLSLAKAFRKHSYWAKDIIFLITEYEELGMQAWLSSYHGSQSEFIKAGELESRGGSIQAALNLEIPGDSVHRFNLKVEGLNGQLPNLDLVNTITRLCRREGILPTLHKRSNPVNAETLDGFKANLQTMLAMMLDQAPGFPTGNHGLFHRYHIEAVTLQGYRTKTTSRRAGGFLEMGRVIEGIFRSLNNLLERFHQSFFFYLLPATDRYVSIGLYMPPFGLLAAPVVIKALSLWLYASEKSEQFEQNQKDKKKKKPKESSEDEEDSQGEVETKESDTKSSDEKKEGQNRKEMVCEETYPGLLSIIPVMIMTGFFALLAYNGPRYSVETGVPFRMPPGESLLWGACALQVSASLFPRILQRKSKKRGDGSGANPLLLKCTALFIFGTTLGALSVMNVSLAFFLAIVWVPLVLIIRPSNSRIFNLLQYIILQLISPFILLMLMAGVPHLHKLQSSPNEFATLAVTSAQKVLVNSVIDSYLYGNWMHTLVSVVLFPNWLMYWALLWTNAELYQ